MFWTLTRNSALTIQLKMLWMNFGHFQAQQILANFTPMFHFFMNLPWHFETPILFFISRTLTIFLHLTTFPHKINIFGQKTFNPHDVFKFHSNYPLWLRTAAKNNVLPSTTRNSPGIFSRTSPSMHKNICSNITNQQCRRHNIKRALI